MPNPLVQKLELFARLSEPDRAALDRIVTARVRGYSAREDVSREGDSPRDVNIFLSGWGCRFKHMEDGRRQIIAFFLPGDVCDLNMFLLKELDHSVGAITPIKVAEVSRDAFEEVTTQHPRILQALVWDQLVYSAVQREWAVNLGQRSATERISHLICELFLRLRSIGRVQDNVCEWPITQVELADTTGMSSVHVSRTLNELRTLGLIALKDRQLEVCDLDGLMKLSMFNQNYLHLPREGERGEAAEPGGDAPG